MNRKIAELFKKGTHNVGVINSKHARSLANGGILVGGDLDNYTVVEFAGYDAEGNDTFKALVDNATKGFLVATVEEEDLYSDVALLQGNYYDFYNAVGEAIRVFAQERDLRFEASNYSGTPVQGHLAYYDKATKKFVIVGATATTEYTNAGNKYVVVDVNTSFGDNLDVPTIRLQAK